MTDTEALTEAQKNDYPEGFGRVLPFEESDPRYRYYCGYIRAENQITNDLEEEGA